MSAADDILRMVAWTTNILAVIVSLVFLICFARIKKKTAGLYLVLVLSISDLTYPLYNASTMYLLNGQAAAVVFSAIGVSIYHFSLFWSTVMAIFCYFVLDYRRSINIKSFVTRAVLCCSAVAFMFGLVVGFQIWGIEVRYVSPGLYKVMHPTVGIVERLCFAVFYHGVGGLTPLAITAYCYYKVYESLKEIHIYSSFQARPARVLWYAAIQIFCFSPEMLIDLYYLALGEVPTPTATIIMNIFKRCWPVLNLLAFWFVMDVTGPIKVTNNEDERDEEEDNPVETNVSFDSRRKTFLTDEENSRKTNYKV